MKETSRDDTILLVDDEEGIRRVLGISLADTGYNVLTAANGLEALEIFKKNLPPIILTDIKMPVMNGIELLKAVKLIEPETEVIMITGHGDMDLAIESLKFEATDFITKPIDDEILEISLRRSREKIMMRRQLREYTENLEELVRIQSARLVEAERLAAVDQVVEGLAQALRNIGGDFEGDIRFFNELPCFVSVHGPEMKVMAINQLARDRLGDLVGAASWDIYTGESKNRETCPVGVTFATGRGRRSQETIRFKNGDELPVIVHTAPVKTRDDETALVLEISADITEVKRIQDELRVTQHRYMQLFDEVPCYVSVQNSDYDILAANRRFTEDFGHRQGECCYEVYKQRNEPCPDCPVARTFEDGQTHQAEMVVTARDGRPVNVVIHTAPILDASGNITEVMEVSTDITRIRELQDHLTGLGLLIGSISHGIKGLMTGLDGGIYKIESGLEKENPDGIREGWGMVRLMIERIRNMVMDILYYAKERELQWERVNVRELAQEAAQIIEHKTDRRGIDLVREFAENLGDFEVDAGVVLTALINILENAVDACLADQDKPDHRIRFSAWAEDEEVVFEIDDNGIGMDTETRENLFTLFYSSKGNRGTGLGLYISNKTVRRHGGSIDVESEPGQGTRFTIRIPKNPPETVAEE